MIVRKMTLEDLGQLAHVHKISYEKDHFTSRLSLKMLEHFYEEIIRLNNYCYVSVDETNNKVTGIVLAGEQTRDSVNNFISKYWPGIIGTLMLNPGFIAEKAKGFWNKITGKKSYVSKAKMRYLNMLVHPDYQGKGIARMLTERLESDLKKDGYQMYGHSVKNSNTKTINFHLKNGCEIEFQTPNFVLFTKAL
jgi:ribosomal protein S18 acetylase RimI-like enzyme